MTSWYKQQKRERERAELEALAQEQAAREAGTQPAAPAAQAAPQAHPQAPAQAPQPPASFPGAAAVQQATPTAGLPGGAVPGTNVGPNHPAWRGTPSMRAHRAALGGQLPADSTPHQDPPPLSPQQQLLLRNNMGATNLTNPQGVPGPTPHQAPAHPPAPPAQLPNPAPAQQAPTAQPVQSVQAPPVQAQAQDGRVRVAIAVPRLTLGGIERQLEDLLRSVDTTKVAWHGIAVMQTDLVYPSTAQAIQQFGVPVVGGMPGVAALLEDADILLTYGVNVPHEIITNTRIIEVDDFDGVPQAAIDVARVQPQRSREEVRKELRLEPGQKAIGFVGEMRAANNPYGLIQAVKALGEGHIAVFVGEGEEVGAVHQFARQMVGQDGYRFLGGRPDVPDVLAAFDVLLVPAIFSGHGYAVLEAWSVGVPVVGTPIGILEGDAAKEAAQLVPRALEGKDAEDGIQVEDLQARLKVGTVYADAITEVLGNEAVRKSMVEAGRAIAEKRTLQAFGAGWTNLLVSGAPANDG